MPLLALLVPLSSAAAQQDVVGPVVTRTVDLTFLLPTGGPDRSLLPNSPGPATSAAPAAGERLAPLPVLPGEVDTGRTWSITGAVVGAVVGAAIGGALGCLANRDDYGAFCAGQSDTKVVIGAVLGAGAGGWIGAVLPGRIR